jgi:hypothetical protein
MKFFVAEIYVKDHAIIGCKTKGVNRLERISVVQDITFIFSFTKNKRVILARKK